MKSPLIILIISLFCCGIIEGRVFAREVEERFIYDAGSRRDPFVPLLDKDSVSGLRTEFTPPREKISLPIEVLVKGVLRRGDQFYAIVNGRVMKTGENIGKVKIKSIKEDKVVLEFSGHDFDILLRKEKEK